MKKSIGALAMLLLTAMLAVGAAGCATQVYVLPSGRWRAAVNGTVGEVVAPYLEFQMDNAIYDSFEDATYSGKLLLRDGWQRVSVELTPSSMVVIDTQGNTLLSGTIQNSSNVAATRQFLLKPEVDNIFDIGRGGLQFVYDHNPGSDYSYVEQPIPSLSEIDLMQSGVRGSISCADAVELKDIRIDIYERMGDDADTVRYYTSVFPAANGAFELVTDFVRGVARISPDVLPEGYGLAVGEGVDDADGEWSAELTAGSELRFELRRIAGVEVGAVSDDGDIKLVTRCVDSSGGYLVGAVRLSGRFDDGFTEAMISGDKLTYRGTAAVGGLELAVSAAIDPTGLFEGRSERLKYLYDHNYIDEARYSELTKQ